MLHAFFLETQLSNVLWVAIFLSRLQQKERAFFSILHLSELEGSHPQMWKGHILSGLPKMYVLLYLSVYTSSIQKKEGKWGTWVAQLVKCPTLAQVMISWAVSSSPVSASVLTARSPEPASDSVSPPLSTPPLLALCVSLSLKNKG